MVFLFSLNAGSQNIEIINEQFLHLKARRVRVDEILNVRNLKDGFNYKYKIQNIDRRSAELTLISKEFIEDLSSNLSIAWAVVESGVIEKTLSPLNELGVKKLILVYCDFSQKNIRLNLERFEKILISSSQQCGRNSILQIEILNSTDDFLKIYPNSALVDFNAPDLENSSDEIMFIGAEGGFSQRERGLFSKKFSLKSPYILRSNTALLGIISKKIL